MTRPVTKPSEPKIQRLALSDIEGTEYRLRPVSEAGVQGLIASIAQIGGIKDAIPGMCFICARCGAHRARGLF